MEMVQNQIIEWFLSAALASPWAAIFLAFITLLGTVYSIAKVFVTFTPSDADDKFLERLEKFPIFGQLLRASSRFSKIKPK